MKKSVTSTQVLKYALKLIDEPSKWIKGLFAARKFNGETWGREPIDTDTNCWCVSGALRRAAFDLKATDRVEANARRRIEAVLKRRRYNRHIPEFNDCRHTTHGKVLGVLKAAIEG